MQGYAIGDPIIVLTLETTIALVLLVSLGLYRYSTGVRYKLWALGWMIYTATSLSTILIAAPGLVPTDGIATSGMLLGSILLIDGARETLRRGRDLLIYVLAVALGFGAIQIGIVLEVSYGFVFLFFGVFTTFSCWYTAIQFSKGVIKRTADFWISLAGFLIWGFSTLLILPFSEWNLLDVQVLITSTGILITGTGLLSYFIQHTTDKLGAQYEVSQLLGSVLSHDVRNYVGSLSESIDQAIASEEDRAMWLELASEIITSMTDFVMEMRHVTATITRVEREKVQIDLTPTLEEVATRVIREYNLESDRIVFELDEDVSVLSCRIVKEMFWNIIDNAFKHGTKTLRVRAYRNPKEEIVVEILDEAGGLSKEIQEFLNNPDSLSSPSAPGIGLGIILIRGLALLCGISMNTQDVVRNEQIVGSLFQLQFN